MVMLPSKFGGNEILVIHRVVSSSSSLLLLSLELSDTTIYEPQIRALLGTASHFCEAVVVSPQAIPRKIWQVCWETPTPRVVQVPLPPLSLSLLLSSLELNDTQVYEP